MSGLKEELGKVLSSYDDEDISDLIELLKELNSSTDLENRLAVIDTIREILVAEVMLIYPLEELDQKYWPDLQDSEQALADFRNGDWCTVDELREDGEDVYNK